MSHEDNMQFEPAQIALMRISSAKQFAIGGLAVAMNALTNTTIDDASDEAQLINTLQVVDFLEQSIGGALAAVKETVMENMSPPEEVQPSLPEVEGAPV